MRAPAGLEVSERSAPRYRPPRWYRRVWAVFATSTLAVWVGAIVATGLGFGVAYAVVRLTEMLKK